GVAGSSARTPDQWPDSNPPAQRDVAGATIADRIEAVDYQEHASATGFNPPASRHADHTYPSNASPSNASRPTSSSPSSPINYADFHADSTGQDLRQQDVARQAAVVGMGAMFPLMDRQPGSSLFPPRGSS